MKGDINKDMIRLLSECDDSGTADFVKWIVGLSIGLIIFSANRIGVDTPWGWKLFVAFIFLLLMFAVIVGIEFISLFLECNKRRAILKNAKFKYDHFSRLDRNENHIYNGENLSVSQIIDICLIEIEVLEKNIGEMNDKLITKFNFQKILFIFGILMVLILGLFYWK